jgi:menaquinone-dependent protoporphyrinogen oxidase
MRILVTVASKHGSTDAIADAIETELAAAGLQVDRREPDQIADVEPYAGVVVGSAVYAGRWMEPARAFIERHANPLRKRPVWLFSSGPLGNPPKPVEDPTDVAPLVERIGAREHRVFSGDLVKERLGFGERAIVSVVRAPYGDFRDWVEIRTWARGIAEELKKASVPG